MFLCSLVERAWFCFQFFLQLWRIKNLYVSQSGDSCCSVLISLTTIWPTCFSWINGHVTVIRIEHMGCQKQIHLCKTGRIKPIGSVYTFNFIHKESCHTPPQEDFWVYHWRLLYRFQRAHCFQDYILKLQNWICAISCTYFRLKMSSGLAQIPWDCEITFVPTLLSHSVWQPSRSPNRLTPLRPWGHAVLDVASLKSALPMLPKFCCQGLWLTMELGLKHN